MAISGGKRHRHRQSCCHQLQQMSLNHFLLILNARQNNLGKTSYCVLLSRKGDILSGLPPPPPPPPNFNVVLEVFVCEYATTSTLILIGGRGAEIMVEGRRMFRILLSPAGFPNFCHNFCPALLNPLCDLEQNIECKSLL